MVVDFSQLMKSEIVQKSLRKFAAPEPLFNHDSSPRKDAPVAKTPADEAREISNSNPNRTWTLDDLPRLARDLDRALDTIESLKVTLNQACERLIEQETQLATINPSRQQIPVEISANLSPSELYKVCLSAAIQANMVVNSRSFVDPKFAQTHLDRAFAVADQALQTALIRWNQKEKAPKK